RLDASRLGVRLASIDVAHLAPPDDVKSYFDEVAQAEVEARTKEQQAREETLRKERENEAGGRKTETGANENRRNGPAPAPAAAKAFEERLQAYRDNPLVREAGRWNHLLQMVKRLAESGQLQPLDPEIDSPIGGRNK